MQTVDSHCREAHPTARPIVDHDDYAAALALIRRSLGATWPRTNMSCGEFESEWHAYGAPGAARTAAIWEAQGEVVGCVLCSWRTTLAITAPGWDDLDEEMHAWGAAALGDAEPVYATAFDSDTGRIQRLQRRGYIPTDDGMNIRVRSIEGELPRPSLPPGYQLRPLMANDVPQRAVLYGRAFSDDALPVENLRNVIAAPTYEPDLDLVVAAPDGSLAAFATLWYDPQNRLGIFEPVGCDPAFQRRGLGTALMYAGLDLLRRRGARNAQLSVGVQRGPANQLYESTGFRLVDRQTAWVKS